MSAVHRVRSGGVLLNRSIDPAVDDSEKDTGNDDDVPAVQAPAEAPQAQARAKEAHPEEVYSLVNKDYYYCSTLMTTTSCPDDGSRVDPDHQVPELCAPPKDAGKEPTMEAAQTSCPSEAAEVMTNNGKDLPYIDANVLNETRTVVTKVLVTSTSVISEGTKAIRTEDGHGGPATFSDAKTEKQSLEQLDEAIREAAGIANNSEMLVARVQVAESDVFACGPSG